MTDTITETALIERARVADVTALTSTNITTPQQLADRVRALQDRAFVLSPMSAVAAIAPGYEITPVVVVIDPSVDPDSGRGADVYFQAAIHKKNKVQGRWEPVEVSLNHYALLRVLGAVGVNVHPTRWMSDGIAERYLWVCETDGDVIDFDGRVRRLPTGIGSLDARDGSPDIGEWTPDEWQKRVAIADQQRAKTPKDDQWKVKPEPINGWTAERVMQARRFGRQLAKTKSLNGLARKLGIRQTYTIEELRRKPFVIFRPMFMPDMSNPRVQEMIAAANLGARHMLYPGAPAPAVQEYAAAPVSHAHGDPNSTFEADLVPERKSEPIATAAAPADAEEVSFDEPVANPAAPPAEETYTVTRVLKHGKDAATRYFVETNEGVTLYAPDATIARACFAASKDGQPRAIPTERVSVNGQSYRQIVEVAAIGGLKL